MNEQEKIADYDIMKHEIAAELGLLDKVNNTGWRSLTARESGRVGGILSRRIKQAKAKNTSQ
ncbi:MAG: alpha/beta-type small acid-soluble spore protein [Defluviitaleaceae bacterium]|nr:alpha/beta-type small acid-soluble spore protein [Defluviitaleaceae bacterium]